MDGATLREIWRPQWSKLTSSEVVKAGIEVRLSMTGRWSRRNRLEGGQRRESG